MRCLSLVVIGLTLAATAASAEPLRLVDTDLDRVTADVQNISVIARVVDALDDDGIVRIFSVTGSDASINVIDVGSATDPEDDDVDHAVLISDVRAAAGPISAVPVSTADAGNAVGDSNALPGIGVSGFDGGAVAGNETSAASTRIVSGQIVVRASSTDNGGAVQTNGSLTRSGNSESLTGVIIGGVVTSDSGATQRIANVERSLSVRNDSTGSGAGIRATSLIADNGSPSLLSSRLDTSIFAGGLDTSAFAGGSITSMLNGSFN